LVQNPEDLPVPRRLGIPEGRLHLLGNGVDLSRFDPEADAASRAQVRGELGVGDDEVVVGIVGRLMAEKGCEVFDAARRARAVQPRARFVVVGPTVLDKADVIRQPFSTVRRLRPASSSSACGRTWSSSTRGMDLFVLASHREGSPRSAMEAAATGLPLVATDLRGCCRQVVEHGSTVWSCCSGTRWRSPRRPASLSVRRLGVGAMGAAVRERGSDGLR
jgi:glycosyltransferase involved in cell wall biosynthesis